MTAPHVTAILCGDRWSLRALYPLVKEGSTLGWIHVAMCGEWLGHPSGPFTFTRETFEQCVRNFDAQCNPVPLDYEHATEWAAQAPAAGWVHRLQVRDDPSGAALWALVEYTDQAADYVRSGQYRFSSGVFSFESVDRRTGENIGCRMTSLALTNVPYLDGQTPIALSQRALAVSGAGALDGARTEYAALATETTMGEVSKEILAEALKRMGDKPMSLEDFCKIIEGIKAERGETDPPAEGSGEMPEMADPAAAAPLADPTLPPAMAAPAAEGDPAAMVASKLMELTGLDAAALLAALEQNQEAIVSAITQGAATQAQTPASQAPLSDREREDHKLALSIRDEGIKSLKADNEAMRAELSVYRKADAERSVDTLVREGRCTDRMKPELLSLALSDRKRFVELTATLPQIVPVGEHAAALSQGKPTESELPINEDDEFVKAHRRTLSAAGVKGKDQDAIVRERWLVHQKRGSTKPLAS